MCEASLRGPSIKGFQGLGFWGLGFSRFIAHIPTCLRQRPLPLPGNSRNAREMGYSQLSPKILIGPVPEAILADKPQRGLSKTSMHQKLEGITRSNSLRFLSCKRCSRDCLALIYIRCRGFSSRCREHSFFCSWESAGVSQQKGPLGTPGR